STGNLTQPFASTQTMAKDACLPAQQHKFHVFFLALIANKYLVRIATGGLALVAVLAIGGTVSAQTVTTAADVAHAVRAEHPPKIDGTLDDPAWKAASPVGDFRQREPLETQPATEKTEVRILYDSRHIYFGIHCYDREPTRIISTQLRRDLSQD